MALFINNQLIDFGDSPGILADNTINANSYPVGTILFDTGLVQIFRNQGTIGSQTWVNYSGGGALNLQDVLDNGNSSIDTAIRLYKDIIGQIYINLDYDKLYIQTDDTLTSYGNNYLSFTNNVNSVIINLRVNSLTNYIQTEHNGNIKGLKFDYDQFTYKIGDFNAIDNNTYLFIDDLNENITLNYNNALNLNGSNVTSATSGSTSGLHLKVTINGVDYVIELRNP